MNISKSTISTIPTGKQLKKKQQQFELKHLALDVPVIGHWSYIDSIGTERIHSAPARICAIYKDHILVALEAAETLPEAHEYDAGYILWLPRTNNAMWDTNNRFEKYTKHK